MDNTWIFVIGAILAYIVWEKWRQWHLAGDIPGPATIPFFGNALRNLDVDQEKLIQKMVEVQKDFGTLFRFWLGFVLFIGIGEPEHLEIVLKNSDNLNKAFGYLFRDFMAGVFSQSGQRWKKLRKILNVMFHNSLMEVQIRTFNEKSKILNDVLMQFAGKGTFDVKNSINLCVLDITCKNSMGIDSDLQRKAGITYPEDIKKLADATLYRMCKVWLYPDIFFYYTKTGREKLKTINRVLDFIQDNIIKPRRELIKCEQSQLKEQDHNPKPYIDQMFEYAKENNISDYELGRIINDVLVGGSDTSTVVVSYILLRLAMDQQLQEKVYHELQDIFGSSDRVATMGDINMMAQLEMVIKEGLRHTTPPHIERRVDKEFKIGKLTMPKGSILYLMLYKLHRNPKYWTHPESFYPDHFLPENVDNRPKYAFVPFSYGLRKCPGHKYSIEKMKVILSTILRRYHLTTDTKEEDLKFHISFMIEVSNGYSIRITERTAN